ncbi:N(6)-adenine-specific methyltransferase METTL4 isoform X1 [Microcaecilia unicolor]|uniref:Methyltransferase-like protein 4 isoform X1 n=1 Tax=Microcaecilia unicolor TaxID=1415580 RepID=A0A6P7WS21_9AMPH|nr:methyltransferase-like protein 4 isoform X1 [Microcaecilia unicolor]
MSVLCESAAGWLLDQASFLRAAHPHSPAKATDDKRVKQQHFHAYSFRAEFFQLFQPHLPSLSTAADLEEAEAPQIDQQRPKAKKRKRRYTALNQGELDALEYHAKISGLIKDGSMSLIQEGLNKGFLHPLSGKKENYSKSVPTELNDCCRLAELCEMSKHLHSLNEHELPTLVMEEVKRLSNSDLELLSHITENNTDWTMIITLMGQKYLLPPKSSFLLSDISCMQPLLQSNRKYDVIVLDPPWQNKSVKRSKRYGHLSSWQIKQIPIPELAAADCLVVTWVTNRQKHLQFVKNDLLPHWSVEVLAEWHWVKITRAGEFVFPLDSLHKKPYEVLVLGRVRRSTDSPSRETEADAFPLPNHKIIVSVPCMLHSYKPPLAEILQKYVKSEAKCLELFARSLQPGWTSWGNEVLKFQHIDYFISSETES